VDIILSNTVITIKPGTLLFIRIGTF